MAFASILKDPYIQRELKALNKSIRSISNNEVYSRARNSMSTEIEKTNWIDGVTISYSNPLGSAVRTLLNKSKEITSPLDNEELKSYQTLIQQLPPVSWKNSLMRELNKDVKKNNLLKKLDTLANGEDKDKINNVNSLKSFSRDVQRVLRDLEEILPAEEFNQLSETKQSLKEIVEVKMNDLFSDDPLEKCIELSKEIETHKDDPESLLKFISSLDEQLRLAKTQVTIPIEKSERKAHRLKYLSAEKSYKQAIDFLIQHYPNVNIEMKERILLKLEVNEFNELENKHEFISFLEQDFETLEGKTEKQAADLVHHKLGQFLAVNAESPEELKKAINLMNLIPFNRIHGDHQLLIAEVLLENNKDLLNSLNTEKLLETIEGYHEDMSEILDTFNKAATIKDMKAILSTGFEEAWTSLDEAKQKTVAQQFLLKVMTQPYRSLQKIENDFNKAKRERLITEADIEQQPLFREGEAFQLSTSETSNTILIRSDIKNKNLVSTETLTFIL